MKKILALFLFSIILATKIFAQGTWTQKASLPDTARLDAGAFAIGSFGYITQGGDANMDRLHTTWEYDPGTNSWNPKNDFAGMARWQGVSFSIGPMGYIGMGQIQTSFYQSDLWEFDQSNNTWTQKASLPSYGRNMAVGFSIGNKGYVGLGASQSNGTLRDFWEYDPALNTWTQKANFPNVNGRFSAVGLSIGTKGYVGTGLDQSGNYYSDFWEYDPVLDSWTQKSNFPVGTRQEIDGAHFSIGNFGYVGTGRSIVNSSWVYWNDFWRYDPVNDSWAAIPNLPSYTRIGASAFTINNVGYVGLGDNGNTTAYNDLWSYNPNPVVTDANEIDNENNFTLYPNPSNGKFSLNSEINNGKISVYNSLGEIIFSSTINNSSTSIDLSDQPNGIYFINVKTKTTSSTQKIIIKK